MSKRLSMGKIYREAYKVMDALDDLVENSSLQQWYKEMIRIRASYLNGCAYCVDSHTQDALKLGIDPRKVALVPVWREAKGIFDDNEQTILLLTEFAQIIRKHLSPPDPVVGDVVAPDVQLVRDVLLREQARQLAGAGLRPGGVLPHALAAHEREVDVMAQPGQVVAVQVRDVRGGVLEIQRVALLAPAVPGRRVVVPGQA